MRFYNVINFLEEKKIKHEYVEGWSSSYDDVKFKYKKKEYLLETAVNCLTILYKEQKYDTHIGISFDLTEYKNIEQVFYDLNEAVEKAKEKEGI